MLRTSQRLVLRQLEITENCCGASCCCSLFMCQCRSSFRCFIFIDLAFSHPGKSGRCECVSDFFFFRNSVLQCCLNICKLVSNSYFNNINGGNIVNPFLNSSQLQLYLEENLKGLKQNETPKTLNMPSGFNHLTLCFTLCPLGVPTIIPLHCWTFPFALMFLY